MQNGTEENMFDGVSAYNGVEPIESEAPIFMTPEEGAQDQGMIDNVTSDYLRTEAYDRMMRGDIPPEQYYNFSGYPGQEEAPLPTQNVPDPIMPMTVPTDVPQRQDDPLINEFQSVREYVPIMKYLADNPEAVEVLRGHIESSQKAAGPSEPTLPQIPEKPSNFNMTDALNDPESESAKYYESVMDYQLKVGEFQRHLVTKEQERIQQDQYKRQVAEQTKQVYGNLISKYGMAPQEAQDFVKTMSNENSLAMDNLVNFYRFMRGNGQRSQVPTQQRPVPTNVRVPGQVPSQQRTMTPDDLFNMQLFAQAKKRPLM